MAAAAHPALDKTLNSTLSAAPPVPCLPLLLGLGVDQRISSFKSFTRALYGCCQVNRFEELLSALDTP